MSNIQSAPLKSRMALQALASAGLQVPFGFDMNEAIELWAGPLNGYEVADVTAGVGEWVMNNSIFPTLEQFVKLLQHESRKQRIKDAPLDEDCPECEGDRWVPVTDYVEQIETFASKQNHRKKDGSDDGIMEDREYIDYPHRHFRPCSLCFPERFDLYIRGHWDDGHDFCPKCRKYKQYIDGKRPKE